MTPRAQTPPSLGPRFRGDERRGLATFDDSRRCVDTPWPEPRVGTHAGQRGSPAMKVRITTALLALMLASSAPLAQQGPGSDNARIEALKASVTNGVEARRKLAQVMNDTVFSFGELAYQEFET